MNFISRKYCPALFGILFNCLFLFIFFRMPCKTVASYLHQRAVCRNDNNEVMMLSRSKYGFILLKMVTAEHLVSDCGISKQECNSQQKHRVKCLKRFCLMMLKQTIYIDIIHTTQRLNKEI